jgi:branched-chain amino acid transport system permease protein
MLEALIIGLSLGCIYGLVAVGFSLIYRTTGVLSFAQGAFVMVGGMTGAWLAADAGVPTGLAMLGGVAIAGAAGLVLAGAVVLPLWRRGASEYVVILGTLMFLVISENLVLNLLGSQPRSVGAITPDWTLSIAGERVQGQVVWVLLATLLIAGGLFALLGRTRLGAAMRATATDQTASRLLGISPVRIALIAFALTAAIGGIGGVLISSIQLSAYTAAQAYSVKGFLAAVLGGLGDVRGALAGGLAVGLLEGFIGVYVSTTYLDLILLGVLVAVLLLRPGGLVLGARPVPAR